MTNGFTPELSTVSRPRPLYWSVRREIWENRSLYIAPLIVAAVVLFGTFLSIASTASDARKLDPVKQRRAITQPYHMAPAPVMLATFIVGVFYALDALYGERRDRSVLFWKSLPVSDWTTVLSKALIPIAVLPLIALIVGMVTQLIVLMMSTMIFAGSGVSPAPLWASARPFREPLTQIYGLTIHSLWFAPIYAWMLLVSAWAKRATFLWAFLPWFALAAMEHVAGGGYIGNMLQYRVIGAMGEAWAVSPKSGQPIIGLSTITPWNFLTSAGLWVGLIFAAICLVLAVKLRRRREPI